METPVGIWYAVLAVCSFFLLHFQRNLQRRLRLLPPGPSAVSIVGNLSQFGSKPHQYLQRLSAKYGHLMSFRLFCKTMIVASSPAMAKEILTTHDRDLAGRLALEVSRVFGHDKRGFVLGQPEQHWRMLRRISATQIFSPRKLESLRHVRRSQVFFAVREIYEIAKESKFFEVRDIVSKFSVSILGNVFFSRDMFHPHSDSFRDFKDTFSSMLERSSTPNVVDFLPFLRRFDPQHIVRDLKIHGQKFFDMVERLIQNRLTQHRKSEGSSADEDLLDTLLCLTDSNFTVADIKMLFSDLLAAGTDTTTITVEWAMAELLRNPPIMQKLQSELDEIVGAKRLVEETDMDKLPYLQAVVKETLRLHPPAPLMLPHRAKRSCEIEGYTIPEDAVVLINYWAITRDPSVWEEPLEFQPERFLRKNLDFRGQNFEYIPFGSGRRMCAGLPLANLVVHSLVGALVQCFSWSLPDATLPKHIDMNEKFHFSLQKAIPLQAKPSPRIHPFPCVS